MISRVADDISEEAIAPHRAGTESTRCHLLTVNVEDYYQVGVFQRYIRPNTWYRFESRLQHNVDRVLGLLAEHNTTATFFVMGWTAEKQPDVVRDIVRAGHEVASRGYLHQPMGTLSVEELRLGLTRSKAVLEDVTGQRVDGFRLADGWLRKDSLWMLDEIAAAGYRYDSSLMPRKRDFAKDVFRRTVHLAETPTGPILEIPLSTAPVAGGWLPVAGGNYQRQLPNTLMSHLVDRTIETTVDPFVMYFHVWELDDEQPHLTIAGRITKMRHYRNLGKYRWMLPQYLQRYDFTSVKDHALRLDSPLSMLASTQPAPRRLAVPVHRIAQWDSGEALHWRDSAQCVDTTESVGFASGTSAIAAAGTHQSESPASSGGSGPRIPVTIVIPCFNEESSLSYLSRTLPSVRAKLSDRYDTRVLFVDDCSTDATWTRLRQQYAADASVQIIRHAVNLGVSGAILTGIKNAETDIVCSMDCDCTYDPHELSQMLPLMTDGIAMVTASPYHADGEVRNVPNWRLFLSRGLSAIYRRVLRSDLATWTSCFRVYRRADILELRLEENGFLGTAEMSALLMLKKGQIIEHPATLESRLFGFSKMRTVKVILGHLRLLAHVVKWRLFGSRRKQLPPTKPIISHRRTIQ